MCTNMATWVSVTEYLYYTSHKFGISPKEQSLCHIAYVFRGVSGIKYILHRINNEYDFLTTYAYGHRKVKDSHMCHS